jgi:UDP-N-acetylmuramate--alanine ligase
MDISKIHKVYFLGIGGIGMSALARFFNSHGKIVAGYDKTPTILTQEMQSEGISITFEDSLDTLALDADLVVYTPAIPKEHLQFNFYKENQYKLHKRAEVLGWIANSMYNICIAGSHGKTSTSAITSYILDKAQKDVAAFLGGVCINYQSNYLDGSTYAVAEADEFDRSFLHLHPNIALITSIDTDHLDIYGNFQAIKDSFSAFINNIRPDGTLVIHATVPRDVVNRAIKVVTYALDDERADFFVRNLSVKDGKNIFDIHHPHGVIKDVCCGYAGRHNVENALGATVLALQLDVSEDALRVALATFKGIRRRFETHLKTDSVVFIDDYAHHPRELDACIASARSLYGNRKITAIFQPHLYSRTRDLAKEFGESLAKVDVPILIEIYPARELPIDGVSSELIYEAIHNEQKVLTTKSQLLEVLARLDIDVLLTVGAGDIDTFVDKIKEVINKK